MFKNFVQRILALEARRILNQFKPTIIAVTGSVGKTTTKQAIAQVLRARHTVLESPGNLNTEFGIPLSILNLQPATNALGWLLVVIRSVLYKPEQYPAILVLEYAVDHPGDMAMLCRIAKPNIAVVTGVESVHLEFFGSREALTKEKSSLLSFLPDDGLALLNGDNEASLAMRDAAGPWHQITYGTQTDANVKAENISMSLDGLSFTAMLPGGEQVTVKIPVLGKHHVLSFLPALFIATKFQIPLDLAAAQLASFRLPPGRLNRIDGIKSSILLDGSYNAEPSSVRAALSTLCELPATRRVAILGDMLELGPNSVEMHRALLQNLHGVSLVFLVGSIMHAVYEDVARSDMNVFYYDSSTTAAREIPDLIERGDLVLIKGSQGARMERITKALMARPIDAERLLVRQSQYWEKKK